MKNKGFSLLELIVVVIIIGILALVSLPNMRPSLEKARAKNAEFNLISIYSAQKRYLLNERKYFICNTATNSTDKVFEITRALSIKIEDEFFNYDIEVNGTAGSGYRALAIRKDGICANKQMSITFDNSTVDKRGCDIW